MICPGCHEPLKIGPELYSKCDNCGTIAATHSIDGLVETENDKAEIRNEEEANKLRIQRAYEAFGYHVLHVMDFGCGDGSLVKAVKRYSNVDAVGIDKGTEHLLFYLASNAFDVVFMVEVIEHLAWPRTYLETLHNLLSRDGIIYLETTFADDIVFYRADAYVDPKIGHRTILSRQALRNRCKNLFTIDEVNANVMILKKI